MRGKAMSEMRGTSSGQSAKGGKSESKMAIATAATATATATLALLCLLAVVPTGHGALQVGFYKGKCNGTDVEATVKRIIASRFSRDRTIVPILLRLHFHDCFARILL
ncbi:hypothetical protein ZIOFF_032475 [Zingiber officinale]|uniref:Plant heme peroxidase family profile domain-containing protein n=1 Tax=Zingiber officinale TaxID=94328 RepID=A0A8J5GGC6_ZINOF|nr:hypothetical protein ZIOFF_032475 [Zingiber officinale]